jgi:cysteinyl-tRNA synthetase
MSFLLHNTLGGAKEPVFAGDGRTLRFYCCGPTVYGPAHIGNFRTFVVQDVFRRVAEAHGLATCHVRNLTDVDDKTIRQSQAEGTTLAAFCAHWTERFHRDCAALNLLPPHHEPGAVTHIPEQIFLIDRLLERGHAYRAEDGSVYFNVASFPAYGRLSGLDRRELRPGAVARETADEYTAREQAADFVLWKARKPADGPNAWASPWGLGRPGWHIECSAMAMRYLGESFDLHSGGVDLIFPHHENEIAQSEAATGRTFVRHWFHVAHLLVDGGKMSKSLGNLYTLDDIAARGHTPAELRLALLSGHYRQPLNFTWNSLHSARAALTRIARLLASAPRDGNPAASANFGPFSEVFAALSDDLNTPRALGGLFSALEPFESGREVFTTDAAAGLRALLDMCGLTLPSVEGMHVVVPPEIRAFAEARQAARARRDWAEADALRAQLTAAGWLLRESAGGYELLPVSGESR